MKRRKELEAYLQSVFNFLRHSLPQKFVDFICLPQYDLHYVLRNIAAEYHDSLEAGVHKDQASWSPVEIHAISERLKAPRPPEDTDDQRHDFVNVADFSCQVEIYTFLVQNTSNYLVKFPKFVNQQNFYIILFSSQASL